MSNATTRPPLSGGRRRRQQVFTATGMFTVPAGVVDVDAFIVAGGAAGVSNNNASVPGSAGGACLSRRVAVTPGATLPVIVGTGGTCAPVAGVSSPTAGSVSSFGGVTAPGGLPASSDNANATGYRPGGSAGPGSGSGAPVGMAGQDGAVRDGVGYGAGSGSNNTSAGGGGFPGGRGGVPGLYAGSGGATAGINAGPNTGAAGGPAGASANGQQVAGGAGGSGIVILEWEE